MKAEAEQEIKPLYPVLVKAARSCYNRWLQDHAVYTEGDTSEWTPLRAIPCLFVSPIVAAYLINRKLLSSHVELVIDAELTGLSMYCHRKSFEFSL